MRNMDGPPRRFTDPRRPPDASSAARCSAAPAGGFRGRVRRRAHAVSSAQKWHATAQGLVDANGSGAGVTGGLIRPVARREGRIEANRPRGLGVRRIHGAPIAIALRAAGPDARCAIHGRPRSIRRGRRRRPGGGPVAVAAYHLPRGPHVGAHRRRDGRRVERVPRAPQAAAVLRGGRPRHGPGPVVVREPPRRARVARGGAAVPRGREERVRLRRAAPRKRRRRLREPAALAAPPAERPVVPRRRHVEAAQLGAATDGQRADAAARELARRRRRALGPSAAVGPRPPLGPGGAGPPPAAP
mmetsp:Transcript_15591/g.50760  ORF Transcript_15591/g.50760 Transcript_15591/m.50760 type:complete len:301 (-) Transcript_15591:1876-2778(-)